MHKAGVVLAHPQRSQCAAHHRHQRVDRDQAADFADFLRRHDVETEPADGEYPRAQREERNAGRRMRGDAPFLAVTSVPRAEQQHRRQTDPAADRMHHHRTGEVVERCAKCRGQPFLHTETAVPGDALEDRIDKADQHEGSGQLRIEAGALGNAAGNDGGNCGGEGQQEEKLHQFIAAFLRKLFRTGEKIHPIGDDVADEEIRQGGNCEISQNLDQRVHLVFFAHRAQFQKSKARMHRQHHDRAEQHKQDIIARFQVFHTPSFSYEP